MACHLIPPLFSNPFPFFPESSFLYRAMHSYRARLTNERFAGGSITMFCKALNPAEVTPLQRRLLLDS
jgi:hypothetical protein